MAEKPSRNYKRKAIGIKRKTKAEQFIFKHTYRR